MIDRLNAALDFSHALVQLHHDLDATMTIHSGLLLKFSKETIQQLMREAGNAYAKRLAAHDLAMIAFSELHKDIVDKYGAFWDDVTELRDAVAPKVEALLNAVITKDAEVATMTSDVKSVIVKAAVPNIIAESYSRL